MPHPFTEQASPSLLPVLRTFSNSGVTRPVVLENDDDGLLIAYSGFDGTARRVGTAVGTPEQLYSRHRFATSGDTLVFSTERGGPATEFIELAQATGTFTTSGTNASQARLDEERGFLYVPTRGNPHLLVLDVRDDSGTNFVDRNYLDLEAMFRYTSTAGARGFRDALPRPGTDLLYATTTEPDGVFVFDLSQVPDDDEKQALDRALLWSFPLGRAPQNDPDRPLQDEDEGAATQSFTTGAGMAMTRSGDRLFVTHSRGNRVLVFDLELGAYGEEIRAIEAVGEYPYAIVLSPDERYAVVANYVGEMTEDIGASSSLSVIDIDSTSPTYLQVVARITNR